MPNENLPGVYLEISGRDNEALKTSSLDASGLTLLRYEGANEADVEHDTATVFATEDGVKKLRNKVSQFETEDNPDREKDGVITPGRPRNADLVQSIAAITEAGLRALWRSPENRFPNGAGPTTWEVWLDQSKSEAFIEAAPRFGIAIGADRLSFPEDVVIIANATMASLALAIRNMTGVRALAVPSVTADFFDGMDVLEQAEWVGDMAARATYPANPNPGFITLLDTGVTRGHPLIQPSLSADDRHAANVAWGVDDVKGHGSQMAGLALFGDLTGALQGIGPIEVNHRLESVKLLPDAGVNPHYLLGAITRNAIDVVELNTPRRRTFTMAVTTGEDNPHDGAPTSWSSEMDQLVSGASGTQNTKRLVLISAGNTDNFTFGAGNYLDTCDENINEIESPAQSWNALCIGAYTEKTQTPDQENNQALAPFGDLSPSSRTASWSSYWPLKPDVVLEGGNWAAGPMPPPMRHGWLSLLTTHHQYPQRSFAFTHDTSAATALASKAITELWSDYPNLWPETTRALFVSSARWTPQMTIHLPHRPQKKHYAPLFQRYGYGVPDLIRARRSASNALTLIVEDTITPYKLSDRGDPKNNEMKLFSLPWPVEELRALNNSNVTMRVTLSTFIYPNPSEPARGSKFRYASHNLRFKLNRADESIDEFASRISAAVDKPESPQSEQADGWDFGSNRRDVGSLHIDQLTCRASDLARRNILAVHPVTGWWKTKSVLREGLPNARFSLIIEIDAGDIETNLYAEVQTAIAAMVATRTVISV